MTQIDWDNSTEDRVEVGIQVADPEASLRFYRDTLGLQIFGETDRPHRHMWGLRAAGSVIKLIYDKNGVAGAFPRVTEDKRYIGIGVLTFRVRNGAAITDACREAGYEVATPWTSAPDDLAKSVAGGYSVVYDPDGNKIEFTEVYAWMPPRD